MFDLHTHTNFSDGILSPDELIKLASERGVKKLSVTDHDIVTHYQHILDAGQKYKVQIIYGVELSTDHEGQSVHLLAYFKRKEDFELLANFEKEVTENRRNRITKICNLLEEKENIKLNPEEILNCNSLSIGRPHIAKAMLKAGYVSSEEEAFQRYLGNYSPYYIPSAQISTEDAIKMVRKFKGLPVIAHPSSAFINKEDLIRKFVEAGLQGLEVYYPYHDYYKWNYYLNLVRRYNIVATGGSDYHGFKQGRQDSLGKVKIPEAEFNRFISKLEFCSR